MQLFWTPEAIQDREEISMMLQVKQYVSSVYYIPYRQTMAQILTCSRR